jgi:ABC-2 type transport system permease protein
MKVLSVTIKDLKILVKDRAAFITLFLSPLMFIIVMSLALGQSFGSLGSTNSVPILLVNDDPHGALARQFVSGLVAVAKTSQLQIEQHDGNGKPLTTATALQLIADHSRSMAVFVPRSFSSDVSRGLPVTVRFMADPGASQQVVKPVQAAVGEILTQTVDPVPAAHQVAEVLSGKVSSTLSHQVPAALTRPGASHLVTLAAVTPPGQTAPKYPSVYQQNVPGYAIMYIFFIVSTMAASELQERRDGTFRRLLTAPINKASLLAGKMLPYYIVNLLQVAILFSVGKFVFGMELGPHPAGLVLITLALSACAVSLGLLVSAVAKTEGQVGGLGTILVLVLAAIGGCMVPPVFMPDFMANLARLTPHGWALFGYQDVMVRGVTVSGTLPTCGVLLGFGVVFFSIAVSRFRFN